MCFRDLDEGGVQKYILHYEKKKDCPFVHICFHSHLNQTYTHFKAFVDQPKAEALSHVTGSNFIFLHLSPSLQLVSSPAKLLTNPVTALHV